MPSPAQIKARKAFVKKYAGKKKLKAYQKQKDTRGEKSKALEKKMADRIKGGGQGGSKEEFNAIFRARMKETKDPVVRKALRSLMFKP